MYDPNMTVGPSSGNNSVDISSQINDGLWHQNTYGTDIYIFLTGTNTTNGTTGASWRIDTSRSANGAYAGVGKVGQDVGATFPTVTNNYIMRIPAGMYYQLMAQPNGTGGTMNSKVATLYF